MSKRDMMDVLLKIDNKSETARALDISRQRLDRYIKNPGSMPIRLVQILAKMKGYQLSINTIQHEYQ